MNRSKYEIYSTSEEAWQAMFLAIKEAKKSIYWELYIFIDDDVGQKFFDELEARAKSGVEVKLVLDSWGSYGLSKKRSQSLHDSGVKVLLFNTKKRKGWWKSIWMRTHRKILVVDENVGFIGGVNIQKHMKDWLDIHVRLEGPIIFSLLRSFRKSYIRAGGSQNDVAHLSKIALGKKYRFYRRSSDEFIYGDAHENKSRIRAKYNEAIRKAKKHIVLFTPYYFPDRHFLKELWNARQRGVRVDLLVPLRSDVRVSTYAAFSLFSLMRKFGVNILPVNKMMHGKGIIVDDKFAIVGSGNLDQTSFYDNYEANVKIKDRNFVRSLKKILRSWRAHSLNFDDKAWEKRGYWQKFKEWLLAGMLSWWHAGHDDKK